MVAAPGLRLLDGFNTIGTAGVAPTPASAGTPPGATRGKHPHKYLPALTVVLLPMAVAVAVVLGCGFTKQKRAKGEALQSGLLEY
eukprot:COSAG01_NODE_3283_length_6310_cov_8.652391_7_plen_85_part_00